MTNRIYTAPDLPEMIERLPLDQQKRVIRTIDSLADDPTSESYVVSGDDSPGGGLRAIHTGSLRVLFSYAPDLHAVIVTDVSSMVEEPQMAAVSA